MSYRLAVYWAPQKASAQRVSEALWRVIWSISAMATQLASERGAEADADALIAWRDKSRQGGGMIESREACEAALRQAPWQTGDIERVAYRARLGTDRPFAELDLVSGIEPHGLDEIFTPNRAVLTLAAADVALMVGLLRALVDGFAPAFGFAGSHDDPALPVALLSDGRPPVGWLTYLDGGYPALPPLLPKPAAAYSLPRGTLLVAHPELYQPRNAEHRQAVVATEAALDSEGVRVPLHKLGGG